MLRIQAPYTNDTVLIDWRTVGPFMTNSHVIVCTETKEAALVDASGDAPVLKEMLSKHGIQIKYYLQTHAHLDHVAALDELKTWHDAPIVLHKEESDLYDNVEMQCRMFGLRPFPSPPPVDQWVDDGDTINFGTLQAQVLFTPGHTPGGISFFFDTGEQTYLFSGDTLFAGSIGRTDLPGGDMRVLQQSLKKLMKLPPQTLIFTGHGPPTTLRDELRSNPFLQM